MKAYFITIVIMLTSVISLSGMNNESNDTEKR